MTKYIRPRAELHESPTYRSISLMVKDARGELVISLWLVAIPSFFLTHKYNLYIDMPIALNVLLSQLWLSRLRFA